MKKKYIKISKVIGGIVLFLYIVICCFFYFSQESIIFNTYKLDTTFQYDFKGNFEEINIKTKDGVTLNSLLFKTENPKGVIFYLHGNSGSLKEWGTLSSFYTDLNYDIFMLDYRSFGKSEGTITNENELHQDIQAAYNKVKKRYSEEEIIVLGYSLGTGFASKIASTNNPRLVILQAPHYNIMDATNYMVKTSSSPLLKTLKIIPVSLILKYKFRTDQYIQDCKMPVVIFHGDCDKQMYYGSSLKLQKLFKLEDELVTFKGQGHLGFTENPEYFKELKRVLEK
jgi:pimeloyl-ACP methyl ester carboxylesterase